MGNVRGEKVCSFISELVIVGGSSVWMMKSIFSSHAINKIASYLLEGLPNDEGEDNYWMYYCCCFEVDRCLVLRD
jgi:hypothetical protein